MCGTYYVDDETLNEIERVIREVDNKIRVEHYRKDIHPTDFAPIIVRDNNNASIVSKQWGYPGFNNKGVIFNARSETVIEKKMFRYGITSNRAVIPARHFYEWNSCKEKNVFTRIEGGPIFLAGFYDRFGESERFVIITTKANETMEKVHDRMPLILENSQVLTWLFDDSKANVILHQKPVLLNRDSKYEQQSLF